MKRNRFGLENEAKKKTKRWLHDEDSAMHLAIVNEDVERINQLSENGDEFCTGDGLNCFFVAHGLSRFWLLRKMLEGDPRGLDCRGPTGETFLMLELHHETNFKYLLNLGADPNITSINGQDLLTMGVRSYCNVTVLQAMISAGANTKSDLLAIALEKLCMRKGLYMIDFLLRVLDTSKSFRRNVRALEIAMVRYPRVPRVTELLIRHFFKWPIIEWEVKHIFVPLMDQLFSSYDYEIHQTKLWPLVDLYGRYGYKFINHFHREYAKFERYVQRDLKFYCQNKFCAMLVYYFHYAKKRTNLRQSYHPQFYYLQNLEHFSGPNTEMLTKTLLSSTVLNMPMTICKQGSMVHQNVEILGIMKFDTIGCFLLATYNKTMHVADFQNIGYDCVDQFLKKGFYVDHCDDPYLISPLTVLIAIYGHDYVDFPRAFKLAKLFIEKAVHVNQQVLNLSFQKPVMNTRRRELQLPDALYIAAAYGRTPLLHLLLPYYKHHPLTLLLFLLPQCGSVFLLSIKPLQRLLSMDRQHPLVEAWEVCNDVGMQMMPPNQRVARRRVRVEQSEQMTDDTYHPLTDDAMQPNLVEETYQVLLEVGGEMSPGSSEYRLVMDHIQEQAEAEFWQAKQWLFNFQAFESSRRILEHFKLVHSAVPSLKQLCRNAIRSCSVPLNNLPQRLTNLVPPELQAFLTLTETQVIVPEEDFDDID